MPFTTRPLGDIGEFVDADDSPAMTMDDYLLALTRAGIPKVADAVRVKLN